MKEKKNTVVILNRQIRRLTTCYFPLHSRPISYAFSLPQSMQVQNPPPSYHNTLNNIFLSHTTNLPLDIDTIILPFDAPLPGDGRARRDVPIQVSQVRLLRSLGH